MISASKWIAGALVVALTSLAHADDADSRRDDDSFLLLRDAVRQDDAAKADFYAARLPNYSIPSYVDYYRLKSRLKDVPQSEIRDFFKRYDGQAIQRWLRTFVTRFFAQQYKRSLMPDGPKVGSVALSPRGDWRMPSDASPAAWLAELE